MTLNLSARAGKIAPFYVMELLQRAKQLEAEGRDVIHMEIGEPDFPTPPTIIKAAISHLKGGQVKYTPASGLPALREQIAAYYQHRYRVTIRKERIFVTPGASGAFLLALGISLNPGDEVIMADPCYPCNSNFVRLYDGNPRTIPVSANSNYQLNAGLIEQHWNTATKGALIASPSNPTGTMIASDDLKAAVETVERFGGSFYSDEIYHGLTYGAQAQTALAYSENVFIINSFSKFFGMTGWRIGWLIVPECFIEATEKLAQTIFISAPSHSQHAALAAFTEETALELEQRRSEMANRRDFLYDALISLGFEIPVKPDGAFYIYADCSRFSGDSFQFACDLLESEGVAVTPGKDFGSYMAHQHLRFAYTTSIARMDEAIQRIERFINRK